MNVTKSDFDKICRMCLLFKTNMFSIYTQEFITAIKNCLDIEVKEGDKFPKSICTDCLDQVKEYATFRKLCKSSEETLQKIVNDDSVKINEINICYNYCRQGRNADKNINEVGIKEEIIVKEESHSDSKEDENNIILFENDDSNEQVNLNVEQSMKVVNSVDSTDKKTIYCKICNKKIYEKTLLIHLHRHQQGKHKCEKCSKTYREPHDLARHLQRIHNAKGNIKCDICRKTFLIQAQMDFHIKRHFKKKYPCDICGKEFAKLKRHKETHNKSEKSFFCLKCDSTFLREVSLKLHVKKYHSETPREKQACPLCNKDVYNIKMHSLQIHSKVRPHKCDQCEKAFAFKSGLLEHVRKKHLGVQYEFKALCPTCGKSCPSQGELKRHLGTHVEERRFDCHLCSKKYKSGDGLRMHLKVHAGLRPYVCTYCTKAFHTNTILKDHIRIHTGERPFACHICGRAFTQKVSLRTHMKVHSA